LHAYVNSRKITTLNNNIISPIDKYSKIDWAFKKTIVNCYT